jgi:hypothetical protein
MSQRAMATDGRLGISEMTDTQYQQMREINGYRYETPPGLGYATKDAMARFVRLSGGTNPKFTPDIFDLARERIQLMDKKERHATLEAMGVLYASYCGQNFARCKGVDHAEFERMFNPNYAPKYADAIRALDLPSKMWWRQEPYESLENLSRIVLNDCDINGKTEMKFEDWYQLFWNYAMPFNPVAFYCLIMAQQMVFTKEFVEELAVYLKHRLEHEVKHEGQPIVHYGSRLGKLAKLLNDTKIVPVPIVAVNEDPNRNPYVVSIPPHCQKKFALPPIEKLKLDTALEKYKPAIVLLSELKTQQDITQDVRAHGCVREYLTIGMPNTVVEGHGWQTFGNFKYMDESDRKVKKPPPYIVMGFRQTPLPLISRWAIHRYDQRLAMGLGAVVSFSKGQPSLASTLTRKVTTMQKRLVTRF